MVKLKLQVLLVPYDYADSSTSELDRQVTRRFLHLSAPDTSLTQVQEEISNRFKKLYPYETDLIIHKLQDNEICDLDPEYLLEDVFNSGDIIRVIVSNVFGPKDGSSPFNTRGPIMIQSTPLPAAAPNLHDHSMSRKRSQDYFDTKDSQIPSKLARLSQPQTPLVVHKTRGRSPTLAADESNVSLPAPEDRPNLSIPIKHQTTETRAHKQRITSGMLTIPAHVQKSVNGEPVYDKSGRSPPASILSSSTISSESSSEDERMNLTILNGHTNQESHLRKSIPEDSSSVMGTAPVSRSNFDNGPSQNRESSRAEENTSDTTNSDANDTVSKAEIIDMFKKANSGPQGFNTVLKFTNLMKNLSIDMVQTQVYASSGKRAAAERATSKITASERKPRAQSQNLVAAPNQERQKTTKPGSPNDSIQSREQSEVHSNLEPTSGVEEKRKEVKNQDLENQKNIKEDQKAQKKKQDVKEAARLEKEASRLEKEAARIEKEAARIEKEARKKKEAEEAARIKQEAVDARNRKREEIKRKKEEAIRIREERRKKVEEEKKRKLEQALQKKQENELKRQQKKAGAQEKSRKLEKENVTMEEVIKRKVEEQSTQKSLEEQSTQKSLEEQLNQKSLVEAVSQKSQDEPLIQKLLEKQDFNKSLPLTNGLAKPQFDSSVNEELNLAATPPPIITVPSSNSSQNGTGVQTKQDITQSDSPNNQHGNPRLLNLLTKFRDLESHLESPNGNYQTQTSQDKQQTEGNANVFVPSIQLTQTADQSVVEAANLTPQTVPEFDIDHSGLASNISMEDASMNSVNLSSENAILTALPDSDSIAKFTTPNSTKTTKQIPKSANLSRVSKPAFDLSSFTPKQVLPNKVVGDISTPPPVASSDVSSNSVQIDRIEKPKSAKATMKISLDPPSKRKFDDSSSEEESNGDSDSEVEVMEIKKPRLVASTPSAQKGRSPGIGSKPKIEPTIPTKFSTPQARPGPKASFKSLPPKVQPPATKTYARVEAPNKIKKPILTSLEDLAARGLPDVKDNTIREKKPAQTLMKKFEDNSDSSESESDSSDDSSSDSSSDDSDDDSGKFLSLKKVKDAGKKKKTSIFSSLSRR